MTFGAAFLFDEKTEAEMRGLWQSLADAGLSNFMLGLDYPPHMTAFLTNEVDLPAFRAAMQEFSAAIPPLPVAFAALGVFGGDSRVVYLAPITGPSLIDLHAHCWEAAQPHLSGAPEYYAPGVWVPHVTIGFNLGPGTLGSAVEVLARAQMPQTAKIRGMIFGDFKIEGGSVLETVEFNG